MRRKLTAIVNVAFDAKGSTIDHIFCIREILEKKWEYNARRSSDFKKAYDLVRREFLHKILLESLVSPGNL